MNENSRRLTSMLPPLALAVLLVGCDVVETLMQRSDPSGQDTTLAGTWVLQEWAEGGSLSSGEIQLSFLTYPTAFKEAVPGGSQLNALLFCTTGGGAYLTRSGNQIRVEVVAWRALFCGDQENALIRAFSDQLKQVDHYEVEGDMLRLYNGDAPNSPLLFGRSEEDGSE